MIQAAPVIAPAAPTDLDALKSRVRDYWQANPCGVKFAEAEPGTKRFYELVTEHRYRTEWHIPQAANFKAAKGLQVLEIGCGLGTDGAQFAQAGADYTGVDLTKAATNLARLRFELFGLQGKFRQADAEKLDFPNDSFDIVYSHGVLHHTPDTPRSIREVHRVLRPGGAAKVMLYHRNSYNYRININILRRYGARLLRTQTGLKLVRKLTGEPLDSLREHAHNLQTDAESYLSPKEFLSRHTDGAGNPLSRVYSRAEAMELFRDFTQVSTAVHFLNKRWLPVIGNLLPRATEKALAARWGWHLWIYATK